MTAPLSPPDELGPYRVRVAAALAACNTEPGSDDAAAVFDALERGGLGDGLPVLAPTPQRVAALLGGRDPEAACGCGPVPISFAEPSWADLAVAAALAGCEPGCLELVAAALSAANDPAFNLLCVQTTTGAAAPLVLVHGPVVADVGLHWGANALGGGSRRGVTIGRAVRLLLRDLGVCRPGEGDMATHGHPGKLSWLVAEGQPASPWPALSACLGRAEHCSGVTVFAGVGNVEVVLPTTTAPAVAALLAQVLRGLGCRDAVLLLPPEAAHFLSRQGWGRAELAADVEAGGAPAPLVMVTGGTGVKATIVAGWGGPTRAVTRWLAAPEEGR